MYNQIDKKLEGLGNLEETKRLADLESIEFEPTEYFKRIKLGSGGKVIQFSDYFKSKEPKIKEINLADYFEFGKTVASLTDAEKEVVNNLLRMSLGKKD